MSFFRFLTKSVKRRILNKINNLIEKLVMWILIEWKEWALLKMLTKNQINFSYRIKK